MTEETNDNPQEPQQTAQPTPSGPPVPEQLDVIAMQLVSAQHQLQALGGVIHSALLVVNMLLAERGRAPVPGQPRRYMSRTDAGLGPAMTSPEAAPGRPMPAHPDRTFGAQRRREHDGSTIAREVAREVARDAAEQATTE